MFGGRGLTLGGAATEPEYTAFQANPMPRFTRSSLTGFRAARLMNPSDLNPFGGPIAPVEIPPEEFFQPMGEDAFKMFSNQFGYGRRDLKAKVIYVDESHEDWIKEKISIDLGYDDERMDVLIFRPKGTFGPVASVVMYPGLNYFTTPPSVDEVDPGEYGLDFVIKSGRALVWAAFSGSLNRITDRAVALPVTDDQRRQFRQMMREWRVDTGRVLDYLEDRPELDQSRLHYMGMSYGASMTPIVLLFEDRFDSAVLLSGGFVPMVPPQSDGIDYFDRIDLPVLMLNGDRDYLIPIEAQEALYERLGSAQEEKRYVVYKAGHWPLPRNKMVNEVLGWFERYEQ